MSAALPLATNNSSSAPGPPPSSVQRRQEPTRKISINYTKRIRNAPGWKAALSLFSEMKKSGINPDGAAYIAITKALYDSKRYYEALHLVREAAGLRLLVNCRHLCSLCSNVPMENGQLKWDLHNLTEATACMLLADALLVLVRTIYKISTRYQDIIVVTGKGLNTEDPNGPVLRKKVPAFLNDVAALVTTAIEENEGRFLITAASLEEWVTSGACEKFKGLFQNRRHDAIK